MKVWVRRVPRNNSLQVTAITRKAQKMAINLNGVNSSYKDMHFNHNNATR